MTSYDVHPKLRQRNWHFQWQYKPPVYNYYQHSQRSRYLNVFYCQYCLFPHSFTQPREGSMFQTNCHI